MTQEILPFATAGGANVVTQAAYSAGGYRTDGFEAGVAESNKLNKVWRQSAFVASALADALVALVGGDVLDDGNVTVLRDKIISAITAGSFSTGDCKITLKNAADSGWVLANDGSIGNGASGGTTRANADTSALFVLLWNNVSNTYAVVQDSAGTPVARGVSAAADFAANRRITLTKMLGRALAVAGTGAGLTARALGETLGAQDATLPEHTHFVLHLQYPGSGITADATHAVAHGYQDGNDEFELQGATATPPTDTADVGLSSPAGTSATGANMQPTSFVNVMIKL